MSDWSSALARHARQRAEATGYSEAAYVAGYLDSAIAGAVVDLNLALRDLKPSHRAYDAVVRALTRLTPDHRPAPEDDAPLRCIDCGTDLPAGDLTLCRACEEKHLTAGAAR